MGFFDFFKSSSNLNKEEENYAQQAFQTASRTLDIDVAMAAHENWKTRLNAFISGNSTESFRPEVVCCDDQCDLGKWIYRDGEKHLGKYATFADLKATHKMFHYCASNIVTMKQTGNEVEARRLLENDFTKLSEKIKKRLGDMKSLS